MIAATQFVLLLIIFNFCHTKSKTVNRFNVALTCKCVSFVLCEKGTEIDDSVGAINIRSITNNEVHDEEPICPNYLEVCCEPANIKNLAKDALPPDVLQVGSRGCGIRKSEGIDFRLLSRNYGATKFGEFPWMAAVLGNTPGRVDFYQCGGALIHRKAVLTAAHCVDGKIPSSIKVRLGEWDSQTINEFIPHQDSTVEEILVHDEFNPKTLHNDVAILMLTTPVHIEDNVDIVCLAESMEDVDASNCIASGWGKDRFDGRHPQILKAVELSLVHRQLCQSKLRGTKLGRNYRLHKSFICAGGVPGEDTCKGDGGSPLVCPLKSNPRRYVQVGIVSWGINCGNGIPGVYANILSARTWIDEQLLFRNLDNSVYQYESYTNELENVYVDSYKK